MIPRPMALVVMPVPAQMQQIQLINQSLFFEEVNRAVNGYEVHIRINLARTLQNLVHIEMLLRVIHDLQYHASLPRHPQATFCHSLLQPPGGLCGVDALPGGRPVRRAMRYAHCHTSLSAMRRALQEWAESRRKTS